MPVASRIRRQPLAAVAVTLGSVALAAFLVTIARRQRPAADTREQWLEAYVSDLLDDAALRIGREGDAEAALQAALRRRAPVIVIERETESNGADKRTAMASALASVMNTALGFGTKFAMDRLTQQLTGRAELSQAVKD